MGWKSDHRELYDEEGNPTDKLLKMQKEEEKLQEEIKGLLKPANFNVVTLPSALVDTVEAVVQAAMSLGAASDGIPGAYDKLALTRRALYTMLQRKYSGPYDNPTTLRF